MSLPPFATVQDLEVRLGVVVGSLSGLDLARAQANLDDASAIIREVANTDWVDVDGVTLTAPPVVAVVCRTAALRAYNNPNGYTSETIGDYGYQLSQKNTEVYLTDSEALTVRRAADAKTGGAYSVRTPAPFDQPYVDPALYFWGLE
jgi:hypothetical protein